MGKLIYKIRLKRRKILKQILRYTTNYIHNMPCHFVSSGVEIPMTNQTLDFIWKGFGNTVLTDSKKSCSYEERDKTGRLLKRLDMLNGESRTTDSTTENRTTRNTKNAGKQSPSILK